MIDKLQIQNLIGSLLSVSHLSTQEDIARAKGIVTELYLKFNVYPETVFTPCSNSVVDYSNSIVDYNCPERTKFLEMVDNTI